MFLPWKRYVAALKRIRDQIQQGSTLNYYDNTTIGAKETHCSWGLCSAKKKQWPDPEDHLWPDQFIKYSRVAPKYLQREQMCPFDTREEGIPLGCFYKCRIFQSKVPPTREEALELYQIEIKRAERLSHERYSTGTDS